MKERPILFSAPMVRAILDGRKTQTRRVVKFKGERPKTIFPLLSQANTPTGEWFFSDPIYERVGRSGNWCPYGKPGDRLWVREAWRTSVCVNDRAGGILETPGNGYGWPLWFEADGAPGPPMRNGRFADGGPGFTKPGRYRHARFMPRWASRITLEITEVRVQRLQSISAQDAIAEGVQRHSDAPTCITPWRNYRLPATDRSARNYSTPQSSFMSLWDSINGDGSNKENPWVWAVSFKHLEVAHV